MWTADNRPRYNRDKLRYPSDLTDAEWAHIEPLIPPGKPGGGKRRVAIREVINGVMYILSTGCHPRPAARLPPHPALRAICQRWARREPGSGARTARRASAAEGAGYRRQRRQYANARPPMPLLRRTHGHHRNLRTQRTAPRATSDRTLMTVRNLNTDRPCRRLTAGHGAVLPKPTPRWPHPRYQTRKPAPRRGSTPRAGAGPQNHRHQSTVMTQQNQPPALKSP